MSELAVLITAIAGLVTALGGAAAAVLVALAQLRKATPDPPPSNGSGAVGAGEATVTPIDREARP